MNNKDVCYKYCQGRYYHDKITYNSPGLEILPRTPEAGLSLDKCTHPKGRIMKVIKHDLWIYTSMYFTLTFQLSMLI